MRIIFLDMDGVLCTYRAHIAQALPDNDIIKFPEHAPFMDALDTVGMGMLNTFTETHSDILYVLSSTWRKQHSKEVMTRYLNQCGWLGEFHPDWKTDKEGLIRGEEIERWLLAHPDTDNYIILDDSSDMLDSQTYHFVQTDEYNGITAENYWHMERIFADGNLAR